MEGFDELIEVMTSFWRHRDFVDVMKCFWLHDKMLSYFWFCSRHDVFMSSWQILDVTNVLALWRMLHLLMSWQTFWRYGYCISQSLSWRHQVRHDVTKCSMTPKTHRDAKRYVMTTKRKNTPWRHKVRHYVKKCVKTSKSVSFCQKVPWRPNFVMTSISVTYVIAPKCLSHPKFVMSWTSHDVIKFVIISTHVMMTKGSSLLKKVRHDVNKISWCQKVYHEVKKFVMKSKTRHDVKSKKYVKILPWSQKHFMTSKSSLWHQKVRHDVKNMLWWHKVRHCLKNSS